MWVRFIFRGRAYGAVKQPYRINAECRVRNNGGQTEYVCLWVTKVSVRTKILTSQVNTRKTRGTTYFFLSVRQFKGNFCGSETHVRLQSIFVGVKLTVRLLYKLFGGVKLTVEALLLLFMRTAIASFSVRS